MNALQQELVLRVQARMKEANVTQRDLAQIVHISEKHLSLLLNGRTGGTLKMWDKLLRAFD